MKTLIYLVRHGESIGNRLRKCLGHTDLGLTDLGLLQAEKTADALSSIGFDAIYSSDLSRAMQTAEPHARMRGLSVIPDDGLREIYLGDWEDMFLSDIIERYGELYTVTWREHFGEFVSPAGESVMELADRLYKSILSIARLNEGKTVLIATHAAAIRAFWSVISGIPAEEMSARLPFPSNASYSILEFDGESGEFYPRDYSVDGHLSDVFTTWKD